MAFTTQRFLINNLIDAENIESSSQGAGTIRQPKKTGTGTATMTPSGLYIGASNLLYTVQCDGAGSVDGAATVRWRTSATAAGSWEATGVSAVSSSISLSNGVSIQFSAGTLVANDKWQFPCYAEYGLAKLFLNDRDAFWKSGSLGLGGETLSIYNMEAGFTGGVANGWAKLYASQTYTDEIGTVHGGDHAQKIEAVADDEGLGISISLYFNAGYEYCIDAWIYASNNSNIRLYHSNLDSGVIYSESITTADTWQHIKWRATGSASGAANLSIYQNAADCTTSDYLILDDIRISTLPYLDIDLGSAQEITTVALLDHNFSSDATLILKGNSSESWVSPTYEDDTFDPTDDPIIDYNGDTLRYWRWVFEDIDNTDGFVSMGNLYMGTYVALAGIFRNIPWGSTKTDALQVVTNQSEAGKANSHVYTRYVAFSTQYFPTRTSGDLTTLISVWEATFNVTTGVRTSILVHYFYDEGTTLYLCRCLSERFDLEYTNYAHYTINLNWEQERITRVI
jgi:hypothetical protein